MLHDVAWCCIAVVKLEKCCITDNWRCFWLEQLYCLLYLLFLSLYVPRYDLSKSTSEAWSSIPGTYSYSIKSLFEGDEEEVARQKVGQGQGWGDGEAGWFNGGQGHSRDRVKDLVGGGSSAGAKHVGRGGGMGCPSSLCYSSMFENSAFLGVRVQ